MSLFEELKELKRKFHPPKRVLYEFPGTLKDLAKVIKAQEEPPWHEDVRHESVGWWNTIVGLAVHEDAPNNRVLIGDKDLIELELSGGFDGTIPWPCASRQPA